MKGAEPGKKGTNAKPRVRAAAKTPRGRIHPVIVYPYRPPDEDTDLEALYRRVTELAGNEDRFARPLTVVDRKTCARQGHQKRHVEFRKQRIETCSEVLDAWCVDTCQMWYCGLGCAFERGEPGDVYWLIPGDFNYGSPGGGEVLNRLPELPEICLELNQDICIGEIQTDHSHPKQLIDAYGTFALLYNWFPREGREIRQYTERPRSEFLAVGHDFLGEMLHRRWYAYEQTLVMLLYAVFGQRRMTRFSVGNVTDLPEGRESLTSAFQQVERTERVLKTVWRERHGARATWPERFRHLEAQSEQIRRVAFGILERLLT